MYIIIVYQTRFEIFFSIYYYNHIIIVCTCAQRLFRSLHETCARSDQIQYTLSSIRVHKNN